MKKVLCSLLILTMMFSSAVVFASEDVNPLDDALVTIIMGMKSHPEDYNLENIDFTQLSVGQGISGYVYVDGELNPVSDVYYPIFYQNKVVILALGHYDNGELVGMQASTTGVASLNTLLDNNNEVAIVSCDEIPYFVSSDGEWVAFYETDPNSVVNQSTLSNNLDYVQVSATQAEEIQLPSYPVPAYDQPVKVSFPNYKQALDNSCWAAVVRGFLYKYTGRVYSEAQIYNAVNLPYVNSQGGTIYNAVDAVRNLGYTISYSIQSSFSFSTVKSMINGGEPMFMALQNSGGGGHAVAITGYTQYSQSTTYAGTIFIMDPWVGSLQEVLVTKNNTFTYTLSGYTPLTFWRYTRFYIS